jgi:hypothetical protein
MTQEPEDEITETQRRALRALGGERVPPPELEDRVVAALSARRLLTSSPRPARRWLRAAAALAASVLIFLAGTVTGSRLGPAAPPPPDPGRGEQFVLFLYEGSDFQAAPEGREMERVGEYVEWARQVGQSGHRVSGEKLKDSELILGRSIPPGPLPGSTSGGDFGTLGGYFVIDAKSLEEIKTVASTCPHLRYGGRIVIRPIEKV